MTATATVAQAWETFTVVDINGGSLVSGDNVFVRAGNGQYFQAANGGGSTLNAASNNQLGWETFTIVRQAGAGAVQSGDVVGLEDSTGTWVSAANGGGGTVFAYGASMGPWEGFTIGGLPAVPAAPAAPASPTTVSDVHFSTTLQGNYVGAQNDGGGAVIATATVAQAWETFTLIDVNGGSLESGDSVFVQAGNGQYFQAANGGGTTLNAASNNMLGWETFQIVRASGPGTVQSGDVVGLEDSTGTWVSAANGGGGTVFAYGASMGPWEKFVFTTGNSAPPPPPSAPPPSAYDYAPYFPVWTWGSGGYAYTSLSNLEQKSGLKEVTLAFVLSNRRMQHDPGSIEQNIGDVQAFIAAGGHVKASFGGASGAYVESQCGSASSLASAIEGFVDATGITDLDFDVEQSPVMTDAMNAMRGQALKMVQNARGIKVAFTLPCNPSPGGGLDSRGSSVVSNAVNAGVTISHVNFMTMDFGDNFGGQALAPVVEGALNDGHAQITSLIPGLTSAQAWGIVGVIHATIGKNDGALRRIFSRRRREAASQRSRSRTTSGSCRSGRSTATSPGRTTTSRAPSKRARSSSTRFLRLLADCPAGHEGANPFELVLRALPLASFGAVAREKLSAVPATSRGNPWTAASSASRGHASRK